MPPTASADNAASTWSVVRSAASAATSGTATRYCASGHAPHRVRPDWVGRRHGRLAVPEHVVLDAVDDGVRTAHQEHRVGDADLEPARVPSTRSTTTSSSAAVPAMQTAVTSTATRCRRGSRSVRSFSACTTVQAEALFRLALVLAQVEEHEASVGAHDRLLTGRVLHLGDDLLGMVRVAEGVDPEAVEAHHGDGVEHLRRRLLHDLGLPVGDAATGAAVAPVQVVGVEVAAQRVVIDHAVGRDVETSASGNGR